MMTKIITKGLETGSLWDSVIEVSDRIVNSRHEQQIFMKAVEEMGELAVEVAIHRGESYKTPGPDGIVGEAVDVINCLIDLIHVHAPHMTEGDIAAIARIKQLKWEKAIDKTKVVEQYARECNGQPFGQGKDY